jgi:hypothetical protein
VAVQTKQVKNIHISETVPKNAAQTIQNKVKQVPILPKLTHITEHTQTHTPHITKQVKTTTL